MKTQHGQKLKKKKKKDNKKIKMQKIKDTVLQSPNPHHSAEIRNIFFF